MTVEQLTLTAPSAADVTAETGGRSRRDDPATARDAARKVRAGTQRARILAALADTQTGLTGYEASVRCGILRVHGATTRLEELEALGFACRDGSTRPTDSGAQATVWQVTAEGRDAARALREAA